MATILKFDGVDMPSPAPDGFTVNWNKVWSSDTGRTQSGRMVGTIVAIKRSVDITFPPLSAAQCQIINNVVSNKSKPFVDIYYKDEQGGETTLTGYFSDLQFPIHIIKDGNPMVVGATIGFIEQ